MKRKRKIIARRPFSLLEICTSLSVLGFLVTFLSWGSHDLITKHQFQAGVKTLAVELRKLQSLALSHGAEIDLSFNYNPKKKLWELTATTDDPLPIIQKNKATPLAGVQKIFLGDRNVTKSFTLSISSSGHVEPAEKLQLYGHKNQRSELSWDLSPYVTVVVNE